MPLSFTLCMPALGLEFVCMLYMLCVDTLLVLRALCSVVLCCDVLHCAVLCCRLFKIML